MAHGHEKTPMITISPSIVSAMQSDCFDDLEQRIFNWLSAELPAWASQPAGQRKHDLHAVVQDGRTIGMRVETDFALYALLMFLSGGNWRDIRDHAQVSEAMTIPDVTAPNKLMWLEGWLAERGHRIAGA